MKKIEAYTEDGLKLIGNLFECTLKNTCIVFIHGMNGCLENNYFAKVWGDICVKNDISFLFGYTRGYSDINNIPTKDGNLIKCGTAYEIFEDSLYDVDLWVETAQNLGYKKIVLLGHSLGCNKVINYLSKKGNVVDGLILASPPDMIGLIKNDIYQQNYQDLIREAENNILDGNTDKFLLTKLWDEYYISSKTLLNYTNEKGDINNLPVLKNPSHFKSLEKINIPILAFMGENDDIVIRSIESDLELIKKKALSCNNFQTKIFQKANHNYQNCEDEIGQYLVNWVHKNINYS